MGIPSGEKALVSARVSARLFASPQDPRSLQLLPDRHSRESPDPHLPAWQPRWCFTPPAIANSALPYVPLQSATKIVTDVRDHYLFGVGREAVRAWLSHRIN